MQVETNEFQVQPQDLYLMCSDGLSEMLGHADLTILTAADVPLDDKVQRLIDAANARGRDNISVEAVQADSSAVPRKRGLVSRLLGSAETGAGNPHLSANHATPHPQEQAMPKLIVSIDGVVIKELQLTKERTARWVGARTTTS